MSKFKKVSFLIIFALIATAILPFLNSKKSQNLITAADEIRLTKGAEVKHPALGEDFITWVEFRNDAYNLYYYNFTIKKEARINREQLSSDVIGPVIYKNFVFWADHTATGWNITRFDTETNNTVILQKETRSVQSLAVYDNYLVYAANGDVMVYDGRLFNGQTSLINITNDEPSQKNPVIYGKTIAWTEPVVCAVDAIDCDATTSNVVMYSLDTKTKTIVAAQVVNVSSVQINHWALTWSGTQNGNSLVKVYNYYTQKEINDFIPSKTYNPVMQGDSLVYFISRFSGEDLELLNIPSGKRTTLGWAKTDKKEVVLGPSSRFVAWIDDRLGTADLYYFDAQAEKTVSLEEKNIDPSKNVSAVKETVLDQDEDGLRDAQENENGTNVFAVDTDNDGLTDHEEITRYHTYPTQYDSDGDGLKDGEEVKNWLSDPLKFDSNNDGIDDKTSVSQGYNPMANRSQLSVYRTIKLEPAQETQEATYLRRTLNNYLGYGRWSVKNQAEWKKITDAYSYGGYNIKEIAAYVRGDKKAVNFYTLATVWREQQEIAALAQ